MKTYKEMANSALSRIENERTQQQKRRSHLLKIAVPSAVCCVALAFGVYAGISHHRGDEPTVGTGYEDDAGFQGSAGYEDSSGSEDSSLEEESESSAETSEETSSEEGAASSARP